MRRNGFGIYDLPLWKDWLFWVTAVGVWAGLAVPESRATVVDIVLAVAVQFVLFGLLPGAARLWVRGRRH